MINAFWAALFVVVVGASERQNNRNKAINNLPCQPATIIINLEEQQKNRKLIDWNMNAQ